MRRPFSKSMHVLVAGFAALAALALPLACGGDDGPPPASGGGEDDIVLPPGVPIPEGGISEGPCDIGDIKDCVYHLPEHRGIKSCFVGVQVCQDGSWSDCVPETDVDGNLIETDAGAEL